MPQQASMPQCTIHPTVCVSTHPTTHCTAALAAPALRAYCVAGPCQVLLVGDSGVGKTCLVMRFIADKFEDHLPATVGELGGCWASIAAARCVWACLQQWQCCS